MATHELNKSMPQGVGSFGPGWIGFMAVAGLGVIIGLIGYIVELNEGMVATGMRNLGTMQGATWGVYISLVVYFVGVSFAGITIAALIRLFNLDYLRGVARMAEVLTVVALVLGAIAIIVDLGQAWRGIVNLFRYARPQSPFFGTFSLVITGYLYAGLVYLYVSSRPDAAMLHERGSKYRGLYRLWSAGYVDTAEQRSRDRRTTYWLSLAIVPLLIIATSSLGFVFGLQVGRPGWFGTLQAPAFVVLAGISGIGHLLVMAAIIRRAVGAEKRITLRAFSWLGSLMMVLLFVYLYFIVVEIFTMIYQPSVAEQELSQAILTGRFAWLFWGSTVALIIPVIMTAWMALKRSWSIGWLVVAGILVNAGALGKRLLIVVPSQTDGQLLPYGAGNYFPTWVEIAVAVGLFSLGAAMVAIFMKFFPIIELEPETSREEVRV